MRRPPFSSLLLLLLLREGATRVFTVGYITGSRRRPGDLEYTRPGLTISGAASLAVAEVNGEPMPPHGHRPGTPPRGAPMDSRDKDSSFGSSSRPPLPSARTSSQNKTRSRRTSAFNGSAENSTASQRSPHWSENPFPLVDLDDTSTGVNQQVEGVKVSEEEVPFEVETWVSSRIPEGAARRWAQAQEIDYGSVVGVTAGGGMETTGGEVVSAGRVFGGDPGRVLRSLGHRLELRVAETYGEEAESIRAAARLWRDGVDAYIGPQETCLHEGRMASAFNLPMVSYFCTHRETSDKRRYPTFARTRPPDSQISKSVTTLLLHFNWTQVAFLHQISLEGEFSAVASTISAAMQASGISVREEKTWNGPFYLGYMDNPFCKILKESRENARVYVILGHYYEHVGLLVAMEEMGMLDSGEYFVVGVDTEPYDASSPTKYFGGPLTDEPHPMAPTAFRSYLGVLPSASVLLSSAPPRPFVLGSQDKEELDYAYTVIPSSAQEAANRFSALVNTYMELPPFSFKNPLVSLGGALKIPPEAAYLYDAVHVYVRALEKVLLSGGDPRNGTAIAEAMRGTRYLSAMGYVVSLDENGDAEGNYTVIGRRHGPSVAGGYAMLPVGRLFPPPYDATLPELRMVMDIDWVGAGPPAAEPQCGFHGEKCITYTAEIVGSVAGGVALALAIISLVLYRNWRYEQALDSLLWKVDFKDIQMSEAGEQTSGQNGGANGNVANAGNTNRITRPLIRTSQASLSSNPDAEWRRGVAYTPVGIFRGRPLAVKKMQSPRQRPMAVDRAMKKELKMMRDLRHDNLICFIGACTDPPNVCILTEYCARGSLRDILENEDLKLDNMFIASLLGDIIRGMIFLHDSPIRSHGSLRPSNCLVDSRWVLKIADFGLHKFKREADVPPFKNMNAYYPFCINGPSANKGHVISGDSNTKTYSSRRKRGDSAPQTGDNTAAEVMVEAKNYIELLLYRAPELLRIMLCSASFPTHTWEEGRLSMALSRDLPSDPIQLAAVLACAWSARPDLWPGTQRGDVYSFSLVAYELHSRQGPMGMNAAPLTHPQIFKSIVAGPKGDIPAFRPPLDLLETSFDFVRDCLKECWHEIPEERPDFRTVRLRLRPMRKGMKANIFDNMMAMMEKYANNLEQLVDERTDQLIVEKRKTDALLYEMLPKCVAEQLKRGHRVEAESYDCVTIYFSDIVGFTSMSAESTPLQVVDFLNDLYTCFDSILENYDVYKVETIGDAYMVVSGLPIRNGIQHAGEIASMSLQLLEAVKHFKIRHRPNDPLLLRIGIHSGPVCAGVVGLKMPRYCLFGDTVNTASRMESNGIPLKIHCSSECRALLEQLGGYRMSSRGLVQMKGKGEVQTHWLLGEVGDEREEEVKAESKEEDKEVESVAVGAVGEEGGPQKESEGRSRRGCSEGRETTRDSEEERTMAPIRSSLRKSEWMSEGARGVPGRSSLRKGLAVSNAHVSRGRAVHQRRRSLESSPKRLRFATEVTGEDSGGELRESDVREMLLDCRMVQKNLLLPLSKDERNELWEKKASENSSQTGEKRDKAKKAKKYKGERKVASSEWCNLLLSNTVPPWRRKGKSAEYLERQDSGKWDEIYGYRRKSRTPTSYLSKNLGLPDPFGYLDDASTYLSREPSIPKARSMLLMNQSSLERGQESSSAHPLATPVNKSEDGLIHDRSHRIGDRLRGAEPHIDDGRLSVPQTDPGFYSSTSCESNQSYDCGDRSNFVTPSISVSLSVDPIASAGPTFKSRSEILVSGDYLVDVHGLQGARLRKMSSEGSPAIKESIVKGSASVSGLCDRVWDNVQEFGEEKVGLLRGSGDGGVVSGERCLQMEDATDDEEETCRPLLLPSPGDEEMEM